MCSSDLASASGRPASTSESPRGPADCCAGRKARCCRHRWAGHRGDGHRHRCRRRPCDRHGHDGRGSARDDCRDRLPGRDAGRRDGFRVAGCYHRCCRCRCHCQMRVARSRAQDFSSAEWRLPGHRMRLPVPVSRTVGSKAPGFQLPARPLPDLPEPHPVPVSRQVVARSWRRRLWMAQPASGRWPVAHRSVASPPWWRWLSGLRPCRWWRQPCWHAACARAFRQYRRRRGCCRTNGYSSLSGERPRRADEASGTLGFEKGAAGNVLSRTVGYEWAAGSFKRRVLRN